MLPGHISDKTIGRLSLYHRILTRLQLSPGEYVHSHQIGSAAGVSAAQVRRDLMAIGYSGSPNRGYHASELLHSIEDFLYEPQGQNAALVGVGNLGRAILSYFSGRRPKLQIVASFDSDPNKVGRVIQGCRCYAVAELTEVVRRLQVRVGILTVPAAVAQECAELLAEGGVRGILNFAPAALRLAPEVYVENADMAVALEKVAYFAHQRAPERPTAETPAGIRSASALGYALPT